MSFWTGWSPLCVLQTADQASISLSTCCCSFSSSLRYSVYIRFCAVSCAKSASLSARSWARVTLLAAMPSWSRSMAACLAFKVLFFSSRSFLTFGTALLLVQAVLLGADLLHLTVNLLQQLRVALGHGLDHLVPGKEAGNILAPQQRGDNVCTHRLCTSPAAGSNRPDRWPQTGR